MARISKAELLRRERISRALLARHAKERLRRERISEGMTRYHATRKAFSRETGVSDSVARQLYREGVRDVLQIPREHWIITPEIVIPRIPEPIISEPILPSVERPGFEEFFHNWKDRMERMGRDPLSEFGVDRLITLEIHFREAMGGGVLNTYPITFNTGSTQAEFWSAYFKAFRDMVDSEWGDGTPGSGKGKSPQGLFTVVM